MSKLVPIFIAIIACAILTIPGATTGILPPNTDYDLNVNSGLNFGVAPFWMPMNASSMVNSTTPWIATFNRTSGSFQYYFNDGHGTDFNMSYSTGFVIYSTQQLNTTASGYCPFPSHYALEQGLSFHGNVAPENVSISTILHQTTDCLWAAQWNTTTLKFEYYYPADGRGVDFQAPMFGGIWFYCSNETSVEYPAIIT